MWRYFVVYVFQEENTNLKTKLKKIVIFINVYICYWIKNIQYGIEEYTNPDGGSCNFSDY